MTTAAPNTPSTTAAAAKKETARTRPLPLTIAIAMEHFPDKSIKGAPQGTVENLEFLMTRYGISSRYNIVSKRVELKLPGQSFTADNEVNCALGLLNSVAARCALPRQDLVEQVRIISDRNAYSPVRDWVMSKPWDGVSRIQALLDTITVAAEHAKLKNNLMRRWLISAVAAAFADRGFESHGVLVFQGVQGLGKTRWFKRLVAASLKVTLDGATLDPNNKDTVLNAIAHWLVELGELDATFKKADIARVKAFVTAPVDKIRRPYDRVESEFQRRTVFFASVNESNYLQDTTGNRRWWTVPVTAIDYEHDVDMQQLWAEVHALWMTGEQHWLTAEEDAMLGALNKEHEVVDPLEEQLLAAYEFPQPGLPGVASGKQSKNMTSTQVLQSIGYDTPSKAQVTHMSTLLKKATGLAKAKKIGGLMMFPMPVMSKN